MSLPPTDMRSILQAVHIATEELGFCRNRVWAVAKSLPGDAREFPKLLPPRKILSYKANKEDHELCTFDFCEQSRVNFTLVKQRHESPCVETRCPAKKFSSTYVEDAVRRAAHIVGFCGGKNSSRQRAVYGNPSWRSDDTGA
jgi:hypothetical protein